MEKKFTVSFLEKKLQELSEARHVIERLYSTEQEKQMFCALAGMFVFQNMPLKWNGTQYKIVEDIHDRCIPEEHEQWLLELRACSYNEKKHTRCVQLKSWLTAVGYAVYEDRGTIKLENVS